MKRLVPIAVFILVLAGFFAHIKTVRAQVDDGTSTPSATVDSQGDSIAPDGTDPNGVDSSASEIPTDLTDDYASSTNASDIEADLQPENPGAFTTVTVTLDSNVVDLRRYMITWSVDGQVVGSGIGKYTLLTKTKGYGQLTAISVAIALDTGTITKTIQLTPEDMTMMWEAVDAYVPPFYEGKKLPGRESIIKIVAIPNFIENGTSLDPANAVYNWSRNGNVVENASGYGNDSLLIKQNMLNADEQIEATASDNSNEVQATGDITIPLFSPKILFYSIDSNTGITSPIAQTSINFTGPSATIVAEPFDFSVSNNNPNSLSFNWTMNDNPIAISDTKNQNTLDLQNPGSSGFANIGLSITDPFTQFQTAQSQISALFGNQGQ